MTRCDMVMFFRLWSLLQLIYSRTLNANFLVSAAISGSSVETQQIYCISVWKQSRFWQSSNKNRELKNVEHFEHFSPGSGADPNLVGGTSRCAASVPCAQALAGQVGFPDKGTALSKANYE